MEIKRNSGRYPWGKEPQKTDMPLIKYGQGEMEETKFGARRESNEGRGRFDLIPYEAIEALAQWYEAGAVKYGDRNWENGISVKDCINRMIRHAMKAGNGWTDEDHLAAVMWNAAAAITMMKRRPDCNDHIWKDENGMELKTPTHEFIAKEFNIPLDVLESQPDPPARIFPHPPTSVFTEQDKVIFNLRGELNEILHNREANGSLSWLEKHALRDICNHLLHIDMVTNNGIPDDLRALADKELGNMVSMEDKQNAEL